eukprot:3760345-Pyramimonas_sp.AAC.1
MQAFQSDPRHASDTPTSFAEALRGSSGRPTADGQSGMGRCETPSPQRQRSLPDSVLRAHRTRQPRLCDPHFDQESNLNHLRPKHSAQVHTRSSEGTRSPVETARLWAVFTSTRLPEKALTANMRCASSADRTSAPLRFSWVAPSCPKALDCTEPTRAF